jgi:hypothetical protein
MNLRDKVQNTNSISKPVLLLTVISSFFLNHGKKVPVNPSVSVAGSL